MAAIPLEIIEKMAWLNISPYEWKVLLTIVAQTYGRRKPSAAISLTEFEQATNIRKPHVCRTLIMLEDRRLIKKVSLGTVAVYAFNTNETDWGEGAAKMSSDIDAAFESWFAKYPVPLQKENARSAYFALLMQHEATPETLLEGLEGYVRWINARAAKFGRPTDPAYIMLAHNFLKDNKFREYAGFKGEVTELEIGKRQPESAKKEDEREKIYSQEREQAISEMEAQGIDPEAMKERLAELSRKFWGVT